MSAAKKRGRFGYLAQQEQAVQPTEVLSQAQVEESEGGVLPFHRTTAEVNFSNQRL